MLNHNNTTKKIEAILFDFGGTLFDFYPSNGEIWAQVAAQFGNMISPNDPQLLQGLVEQADACDRLMLTRSIKLASDIPEREWLELNGIVLSAIGIKDPDAVLAAQKAFVAREGGYKIFHDSRETLKDLKDFGKHIGLVSNSTPKGAAGRRPILQEQGILDYFESIILSSEVGVAKPDREIFKIALREMNLKNPSQVWHIGDSYVADVIGARNAGLIPVLFDPTGLRKPDCLCIQTLSDVVALVRQFNEETE
ncbi:MAG: HAD family hydrolase [Candidatus Hodarchaeota archaeon]